MKPKVSILQILYSSSFMDKMLNYYQAIISFYYFFFRKGEKKCPKI